MVDKIEIPKRLITGAVVSDKMGKTVGVRVERTYIHPKFHKTVRSYKNYKVHDELEQACMGDLVTFYESRPYSKTKHACLHEIIKSENQ